MVQIPGFQVKAGLSKPPAVLAFSRLNRLNTAKHAGAQHLADHLIKIHSPDHRVFKQLHRGLCAVLACMSIIASTAVFADSAAPITVKAAKDIFYGQDESRPDKELQTLDLYWQDNRRLRPVIIYVHGGGWAFGDKAEVNSKPDFFVNEGIAFLSMNYRLRWDHKVFDQLEDVVSVIDWVRKNSKTYGLDPKRVILMGHGAGAHLVSLVGTDDRYLKSKGLDPEKDIRAIVAIDSISYDIPRVHKELGSFIERRQHRLIFGDDEKLQLAASPIHYVDKSPNVHQFALLYVADSEASSLQAQAFAKALISSNVSTIMVPGNSKTKQSIDVELGAPNDAPTGALMAFIRASI